MLTNESSARKRSISIDSDERFNINVAEPDIVPLRELQPMWACACGRKRETINLTGKFCLSGFNRKHRLSIVKPWNEQQRHLQRWLDQELSLDEHRALSHAEPQSEDQLSRLDHVLKSQMKPQHLDGGTVEDRIALITQQLSHRPAQSGLRISWPDVGLAACIILLLGTNLGMAQDTSWSPLLIGSLLCCIAGMGIVALLLLRRQRTSSPQYWHIPGRTILRLGAWLVFIGGAATALLQAITNKLIT